MESFWLSAILAWGIAVTGIGQPGTALPQEIPAVVSAATTTDSAPAAVKSDKPEVSISAMPAAVAPAQPQSQADQPLLTFPVLSDIHVQASDPPSQKKFKAAMNDLNEVNPDADALVINGDLTSGLPEDYDRLGKLMSQLPHPDNTFYSIGNHEFYKAWYNSDREWSPDTFPNGETEQASIARFLRFSQQANVYYDEMVKGYHFIFLGSERYMQSDPSNNEDAFLTADQLSWLKQTLAKGADPKKPIFVFLHQPLPNTVAGTNFWAYIRAVVQYKELKDILSQYPQVVFFTGHTHWDLKLPKTLVTDKFTMVNSSSVYDPLTDDGTGSEIPMAPEESEGLYVQVYADRVVIQGRDFYRKQWIPGANFSVPLGKTH